MAKRKSANQDRASVSLLLGVVSIIAFLWWFVGLAFGVLGVIFGIVALKGGQDKGKSIAGIVLAVTGIFLGSVVALLVAVTAPKDHTSVTDSHRESEMTALSLQIDNILNSSNAKRVKSTDLSIKGFTVIKSISPTDKPTKTSVLFEADKKCSGAASPGSYSITVLMDNDSPYCSGYQLN